MMDPEWCAMKGWSETATTAVCGEHMVYPVGWSVTMSGELRQPRVQFGTFGPMGRTGGRHATLNAGLVCSA